MSPGSSTNRRAIAFRVDCGTDRQSPAGRAAGRREGRGPARSLVSTLALEYLSRARIGPDYRFARCLFQQGRMRAACAGRRIPSRISDAHTQPRAVRTRVVHSDAGCLYAAAAVPLWSRDTDDAPAIGARRPPSRVGEQSFTDVGGVRRRSCCGEHSIVPAPRYDHRFIPTPPNT